MEESILKKIAIVKKGFAAKKTRPLQWRLKQIEAIKRMLVDTKAEVLEAMHKDLKQTAFLAFAAEIDGVIKEADYFLEHLEGWMKPEQRNLDPLMKPGKGYVVREPFGTVLIISPWNYPISLLLKPLIGALSAGNTAIIKPSEVSAACCAYISRNVAKYLDPDCVQVVEGSVAEATFLLTQRFDYIFYTGNTMVGKIVMKAAAEFLTPTTLELGDKSPCIVDESVDLDVAAKRICWGKFANCGQTCVAPDYVLVHKKVKAPFLEKVKATIREFYGENAQKSKDYSRIINERHTKRLQSLIEGHTPFVGGKVDIADHYVEPTVLNDVSYSDPIMQSEIFGPILPVFEINNLDEAIQVITEREKPLALYMFSTDEAHIQYVLANTSAGGTGINEVVFHVACRDLPFGGVGESGMGNYNGRSSFLTFSHKRSVLHRSTWPDPSLRYPPYTDSKIWWYTQLSNFKIPTPIKMVLYAIPPLVVALLVARYMQLL